MMSLRSLALTFAAALAISSCARSSPTVAPVVDPSTEMPVPAPSDFPEKIQNESSAYWIDHWRAFKREASEAKGVDVVLLGDSMTERFPADLLPKGVRIANCGIGGDKVGGWKYYGLVDRLDVSVCDLAPKAVVVMIGVNDIAFAGTPAESMVANYDRLLGEMRACVPKARIVALPVLPVRTGNKAFNPQIVAWNATVRATAARHGCEFVDLHPLFLDAVGELKAEYASDTIHLNAAGYAVWAEKLEEIFGGEDSD